MKIPAIIRHNLGLKIIAIIGALVIWVGVNWSRDSNQIIERVVQAEVLTSRPPEGLEVVRINPSEINLTLAGRATTFSGTDLQKLKVVANLNDAKLGTQNVSVSLPELPEGLELVNVSRKQVRVELEEVITVLRQVEVITRGRPADGFATRGWQVKPETVDVTGAASHVQEVADVVALVDVSGESATVKEEVNPEARDANNVQIEQVKISPSTVSVTVAIKRVNTKTVPVTPVIGEVPRGYRLVNVKVEPTTVTISGEGERLKSVNTVDTSRVDISDLRGTSSYSVPLRVSEGVTVMGPNSARVTVTLERQRTSTGSGTTPPPRDRTDRPDGDAADEESSEGEPRQGGIQVSPDEGPEDETPPPAEEPADDADEKADEVSKPADNETPEQSR
ncbi:MAG: CdaR family protein [Armatimonadota bacterium]